jgi:oxygen-dependent protoporphyrinogen oxidase
LSAPPRHRPSRRAVVVGAGATGLAAAHKLLAEAEAAGYRCDVKVLEAGSRPGGLIRTERHDGMVLEGGPDSLVAQKPAGIALCRELGLGDELVEVAGGGGSLRILHAGKLHPLPDGFLMMAPTRVGALLRSELFSPLGKLRMALEPWMRTRRSDGDESLRSFVVRRLGREAYNRAAEPIIGGVYTADGDAMSLSLTMPRFRDLERRHGSVICGLRAMRRMHNGAGPAFAAPREGMSSLVDALVRRLPTDSLRLRTAVTRVRPRAGGWQIECDGADPLRADAVLLACPAAAAARLLHGVDAELADEIAQLPYASCATVNLVYRGSAASRPLEGHGFFAPRTERVPILGCSYVSVKFPGRVPRDRILMRVFLGGALDPGVLEEDDGRLIARADRELARILGFAESPVLARVHRFPHAMPQYPVGHDIRIAAIRTQLQRHPGLFLAGSVMGAVGIPDCIASGHEVAAALLQSLDSDHARLEMAI